MVVLLFAEQQAKVHAPGADLTAAAIPRVGIDHFGIEGGIARQHVLLFGAAGFYVVAGHQRQREIYRRAAGIRRNVQPQRLALIAQVEQAAIGENAAGLADDQLAHVQELAINLLGEEAPGVIVQLLRANLQLVIEVAIILLKMLGAQQHAFLPDDFVQTHAHSPCSASGSTGWMPCSSSLNQAWVRSRGSRVST